MTDRHEQLPADEAPDRAAAIGSARTAGERGAYQPPQLTLLGTLAELTHGSYQTGTGDVMGGGDQPGTGSIP